MRVACIGLWLFIASMEGDCQQASKLQARISVMHRRDGGTAQFFENISFGATIEYPRRNQHPMFRVYAVTLLGWHHKVNGIVIESYRNNKLLSTATPRFNDHEGRISFVDGYVSTKEDKVKVRLLFESNQNDSQQEWFFFVNFK